MGRPTEISDRPVFRWVDPPRSRTVPFSDGSTHRDLEPSRFRMGRPTEISNRLVFGWVDPPRSGTLLVSPPTVRPTRTRVTHAARKRGFREAERLRETTGPDERGSRQIGTKRAQTRPQGSKGRSPVARGASERRSRSEAEAQRRRSAGSGARRGSRGSPRAP